MVLKKVKFNKDWYDRLISKTNEKNLLLLKLKRLLSDKEYKSCLEIGLGTSPYLANKLYRLFGDYTIIEKEEYKGNLPKSVQIIQEDWENTKITKKYDVIIASHVIYYFNNKKEAIRRMINSLNENGILILVVNGNDSDYGLLKKEFSNLVKEKYKFTYDIIKKLIEDENYVEYTTPSIVKFKDGEDLFTTLKISFDAYPKEYLKLKREMIDYFDSNLKGNEFKINQKIIVVKKEKDKWGKLINHKDYEINIKDMTILIKDGVFTPDPKITNTSLIILDNIPEVKDLEILDVGCGTGIISAYCALKGARHVLAVDNSDKALENTRINLKKNNVEDKVSVKKSNLFECVKGRFDYIFANLPILYEVWDSETTLSRILEKFLKQCKKYIKKKGKVYITWASFSDIMPLRRLCAKLGYKFKEKSENKLGIEWYIIEISFD